MKKTKLIALGIALAGVTLVKAQDAEVILERTPLPPPDDAMIEPQLIGAIAGQRVQLTATADRLADAAKAQAGAQKRLMLAQAGGGGMGRGGGLSGDSAFDFTTSHQRSPRVLVIPKEAGDAKSFAEVEEDLGVMAHILDKAASAGDKTTRAMGISVFLRLPGNSAAPQNIFIEGYGAIFLLNVNFPLQPPPAKEGDAEAKEPVSNEWEEAKRELSHPGKVPGSDPFVFFEERFGGDAWNAKMPVADYDADKVEDLKKDLIAALKNAANIRRLKSDELVTVVVTGAEAGVVTKAFKSGGSKSSNPMGESVAIAKASAGERKPVAASNKIILRVRKADAEAFQNGKLDFEAFRKKVALLTL